MAGDYSVRPDACLRAGPSVPALRGLSPESGGVEDAVSPVLERDSSGRPPVPPRAVRVKVVAA